MKPKIGSILSFSQNCHQLPEILLMQAEIGIIWSVFQAENRSHGISESAHIAYFEMAFDERAQ